MLKLVFFCVSHALHLSPAPHSYLLFACARVYYFRYEHGQLQSPTSPFNDEKLCLRRREIQCWSLDARQQPRVRAVLCYFFSLSLSQTVQRRA